MKNEHKMLLWLIIILAVYFGWKHYQLMKVSNASPGLNNPPGTGVN